MVHAPKVPLWSTEWTSLSISYVDVTFWQEALINTSICKIFTNIECINSVHKLSDKVKRRILFQNISSCKDTTSLRFMLTVYVYFVSWVLLYECYEWYPYALCQYSQWSLHWHLHYWTTTWHNKRNPYIMLRDILSRNFSFLLYIIILLNQRKYTCHNEFNPQRYYQQ